MENKWDSTAKTVFIVLSLLGIIFFFSIAYPLIAPLLISILLVYLLEPAVDFVKKRIRLSHRVSVTVIFLLFWGLLITAFSFLIPILISQMLNLATNISEIQESVILLLSQPISILGQSFSPDPQLLTRLVQDAGNLLTPALEDAVHVLELTSNGLIWVLIVIVSSYYFLLDWKSMHSWFIGFMPRTGRSDISKLLHEIDEVWRAYVRGTLLLMLLTGIIYTVILEIVGLPDAYLIGIATGFLVALPEIGPLFAGVIGFVIALFQGSDFLPISNAWFALLILGIYFVLGQIRVIWLQPRLLNRFLHIHPGIGFVILVSTLILQGVVATLYVIPLLASLSIIVRYVRCRLFDVDPWTSETFPSLAKQIIRERPTRPPIKPVWLDELEEEFRRLSKDPNKSKRRSARRKKD